MSWILVLILLILGAEVWVLPVLYLLFSPLFLIAKIIERLENKEKENGKEH